MSINPHSILEEARSLIGERGANYGGIEDNFSRIATIAQTALNVQITPYQVAMVHVATKLARMAGPGDKHDNYVDAINYLAFADLLRPRPRNTIEIDIVEMAGKLKARMEPETTS